MKGQGSNYGFVIGGVVMSLFLMVVLAMYGQTQIGVNCPQTAENINNQFNSTGILGIVTGTGSLAVTLVTSPCSGLPWWVYAFTFVPVGLSLAIFLTPFIGN